MDFQEVVDYAKEAYELAQVEIGNEIADAAVKEYWVVVPEDRVKWLDYGIKCSAETKMAWDSMMAVVTHLLRHDLQPPYNLAAWLADVNEGKLTRPKVAARETFMRDQNLTLIVYMVAERWGINPTRNATAKEESACDAVAKAANLSYKAVEAAYRQHRPTEAPTLS